MIMQYFYAVVTNLKNIDQKICSTEFDHPAKPAWLFFYNSAIHYLTSTKIIIIRKHYHAINGNLPISIT